MTQTRSNHIAWEGIFGLNWAQDYAIQNSDGKFIFVLEDRHKRHHPRVVRNDSLIDGLPTIAIPPLGEFCYHDCLSDPVFSAYQKYLGAHSEIEVLRYRPGKRITLKVRGTSGDQMIAKLVAKGGAGINRRAKEIWTRRAQLNFAVAEPVASPYPNNMILQKIVPGTPLRFEDTKLSATMAKAIADSLRTLHWSDINFNYHFNLDDQLGRTNRYIDLVAEKFPRLNLALVHLTADLGRLHQKLGKSTRRMAPVHGSPHTKQWLQGDSLGLIDFDRAAIGHPELDIATFLAEWDYEHGEIGEIVKNTFLDNYGLYDPQLMAFYRAHKHIAKAFKASKSPDRGVGYRKTKRNLLNAISLLV